MGTRRGSRLRGARVNRRWRRRRCEARRHPRRCGGLHIARRRELHPALL